MNKYHSYTLFIFASPPYTGTQTTEGFDALFAYAAFEQPVALLFQSDGIYQLTHNQNPSTHKNIGKMLQAFEMYEIPTPLVCADALDKRGFKPQDLPIECKIAGATDIARLINESKNVMVF